MSNLKSKIFKLFDVYLSKDTSTKDLFKDLERRGKIDNKKIIALLVILIDEVDSSK